MICNIFLCVMPRPSMASASGCYQGGAKSFAQHGVMRFVAALLGLRAQDMKTGAPAHFHLRCATVKTSHTPGTLHGIVPY